MKKIAVLPASGIGDGLLMMIASHQLKTEGNSVTTFHSALPELASWFPGHDLQRTISLEKLASYDQILVENDNSPFIQELLVAYRSKLSIFYPTYSVRKHAPLLSQDAVFDKDMPMADNIGQSIASLLGRLAISKENGLSPPQELAHRQNSKQVLLHPTSREAKKDWRPEGFLKVAKALEKKGFSPIFCTSLHERNDWLFVEREGFPLAKLPTLSDLASLIYTSGFVIGNDSLPGHLASNLGVASLIIANDPQRMRLWRPGWLQGEIVLPPPYLPNWKFLRLREKNWQSFVTAGNVLEAFDKLCRLF